MNLLEHERARVLRAAEASLGEEPGSVTAARSGRSPGGPHDYYSEAPYWWPDPAGADRPYVRRDGLVNPALFFAHREGLIRMSRCVTGLVAGFVVTGERRYSEHAVRHLRAWFVDAATAMAPRLRYGQSIPGSVTGRHYGIIDTLHLAEVAQAIRVLARAQALPDPERRALGRWFGRYLRWLALHPFGIAERSRLNNHGTSWVVQAAAYARLTGGGWTLRRCARLLARRLRRQIAPDGSFPIELRRTRPYAYSLFQLDLVGIACQILWPSGGGLWQRPLAGGPSVQRAFEFHLPFVEDRASWPYGRDIVQFEELPVRIPSLLFAGIAFGERRYVEAWKRLEADPVEHTVLGNLPVYQPVLWLDSARVEV